MAMHTMIALNPGEAKKMIQRDIDPNRTAITDQQSVDMSFALADPWFQYVPPPPDEATLKALG